MDAVLIGAWAEIEERKKILDVGTGCGVIALMCCQRNPRAEVTAIDIDEGSLEEATYNFHNSPWADRLKAVKTDYSSLCLSEEKFDYIISNPPFFSAGKNRFDDSRVKARHQGVLSPVTLLQKAPSLLSEGGRVGLIMPVSELPDILKVAEESRFCLSRYLFIKGHAKAPVKRILLEFIMCEDKVSIDSVTNSVTDSVTEDNKILILEDSPGCPTEGYQALCRDFYLKF